MIDIIFYPPQVRPALWAIKIFDPGRVNINPAARPEIIPQPNIHQERAHPERSGRRINGAA